MHTSENDKTRIGDDVFKAFALTDVADNGEDFAATVVVFTLCNVDLPCVVLDGTIYLQAPLQDVFDAFAAYLSDGIRHLETRVSEARSSALAFDGIQRSLFGTNVVIPRVVPDSGER